MTSVPARIDDPEKAALPEHCIDSAGFFVRVVKPVIAQLMDEDGVLLETGCVNLRLELAKSIAITKAINGELSRAEDRLGYAQVAKSVIC